MPHCYFIQFTAIYNRLPALSIVEHQTHFIEMPYPIEYFSDIQEIETAVATKFNAQSVKVTDWRELKGMDRHQQEVAE